MMRIGLLLALLLCLASAARRKRSAILQPLNVNYSVNLAQFYNTSYIWTYMIATRTRGGVTYGPTVSCRVDRTVCVTLTNVVQVTNYTNNRLRHSEELTGIFLDPQQGRPTSALLMNTGAEKEFRFDVLLYASPGYTCGLFYAATFSNSSLWQTINKTRKWPDGITKNDVIQNLEQEDATVQCHIRVKGTDAHPQKTKECDRKYYEICRGFVHWVVYWESCPHPPKGWD